MRVIVAGCEYVGKTTLSQKMQEWGKEIGIRFHMDDHFSLPDTMHLSEEDQKSMLALSPLGPRPGNRPRPGSIRVRYGSLVAGD